MVIDADGAGGGEIADVARDVGQFRSRLRDPLELPPSRRYSFSSRRMWRSPRDCQVLMPPSSQRASIFLMFAAVK